MGHHFDLIAETPPPNLVPGMKWLLGTYTGRFNPPASDHRSPLQRTLQVEDNIRPKSGVRCWNHAASNQVQGVRGWIREGSGQMQPVRGNKQVVSIGKRAVSTVKRTVSIKERAVSGGERRVRTHERTGSGRKQGGGSQGRRENNSRGLQGRHHET